MWTRETENCLEKTELKIGFEEVETVITPHSYSFAVMVGKGMK